MCSEFVHATAAPVSPPLLSPALPALLSLPPPFFLLPFFSPFSLLPFSFRPPRQRRRWRPHWEWARQPRKLSIIRIMRTTWEENLMISCNRRTVRPQIYRFYIHVQSCMCWENTENINKADLCVQILVDCQCMSRVDVNHMITQNWLWEFISKILDMLNIGDISSLLFRCVTGAVFGVLHPASHLSPPPVPLEQIQIASKKRESTSLHYRYTDCRT